MIKEDYDIEVAKEYTTLQERIETLAKENAELKKQLEMSNKVYNDNLDYSHHIEGQLTNAKELLKKCVCIINRLTPTTALLDKNERSLLKQAEQFLKDCEVEK